MPLVKCINGHTGCAATERYLERDGRAIGHDFINLACIEREDGSVIGWAAEMDEFRSLYGNDEPYRGKPAITYRHYIVSPDPADKIDLERLCLLRRFCYAVPRAAATPFRGWLIRANAATVRPTRGARAPLLA